MSINDINNELDDIKSQSTKEVTNKNTGIDNILKNNIKNIEEFMNKKIVNIYSRPWKKLEKKLKKNKIREFINKQIETNVITKEESSKRLEILLKEVDLNKKMKVNYNVELCIIESIMNF